jgi:methyltransferase
MIDAFLLYSCLAALFFLPMLVEARRAAGNERAQFARGGIEPPGDVYRVMRVVYPAAFAAMLVEGFARGGPSRAWCAVGLACFGAAKSLKWWAVVTLGPFWTFRVVVLPGAPLIDGGPYRFVRHPNYIAVVLELVGAALLTGAAVSGPLAVVLFGVLLARRMEVEDRALRRAARHPPCSL